MTLAFARRFIQIFGTAWSWVTLSDPNNGPESSPGGKAGASSKRGTRGSSLPGDWQHPEMALEGTIKSLELGLGK